MTGVSDISDDVVACILAVLVGEDIHTFSKWKTTLYMLHICQKWRALGKPLVYSRGYIGSIAQYSKSSVQVVTNMPLICGAASTGCVKTLVISHYTMDSAQAVLACIDNAVSMNRSPWPKLRAVSLFHHFATHAHTARRLDTAEAAYVDQVANTFFRYIPSIAQLNVIAHRADAAMHRFTSTLVCKYAPKLAHLSYTGIAFYSSSPVVLRLKSLDLDFTKIPVAIPLKIDPAALSNLALQNVGPDFPWSYFTGGNSGPLIFENLEYLSLANTGLSSLSSSKVFSSEPVLYCPRLEQLSICGPCCSLQLLQCLLRAPLQTVEISWSPLNIEDSGIECLSSLKTLTIKHEFCEADSASNLQFFARTNALFTKTKRIRLTRLLLYSDIGSLQWSQAQWPYLTYLGLQNASVALEGVFELVSALSDLRQLKVRRLRMPTTSEFTGAPDTYLQNLRDRYKQPSSAWLQWFAVEFPPPFSPEYLVHTVETVRWYLPRLRHVIIPQDSP